MTPSERATNFISAEPEEAISLLFQKLDRAIDDMEQGRVLSLEEAWEEIDQIYY